MWNEWSLTEQVLLCVVAAMWLYQMYFYLRYILAAVRRTRPTPPATNAGTEEQTAPTEQPGVSVIVCAKNEEQNLRDYLQALFTQDYPEYEVIVVNDGSVDDTRTFLEYWQKRYRNLRLTFVPIEAQVTSTKKLAITLGAKAAQYDYLLLTDADCRPESPHWISEMMKGFAQPSAVSSQQSEVSIVLGFGAYFVKPGLLNRLIQFDTLLNGLQYLGMAVCGHPYMGVGRNLAYRKQLFFAHGGFYGLLNNKAGDDDLFVNREATATNTAVVCTPDSLTWSVPKNSLSDWLHQKRRHLSVAPKYKFATKLRLGLEPLTRGLLYAAVIALVVVCGYRLSVTGYRSAVSIWLPAIIAMSAMLLRWLMQSILLNIPARRWGVTRTVLLIPLWEILLPLITLTMMLIEPLRPKPKRW
ncbi:MAG: glycosyltransferase [Paludibacteraceae bacterium]|nr:glycosyltransferase [Paludibacteraceae bacterium]